MKTNLETGEIPTVQPAVYTAMTQLNDVLIKLRNFSNTENGHILDTYMDPVQEKIDDAISKLGEAIGDYAAHQVQTSR